MASSHRMARVPNEHHDGAIRHRAGDELRWSILRSRLWAVRAYRVRLSVAWQSMTSPAHCRKQPDASKSARVEAGKHGAPRAPQHTLKPCGKVLVH